MLDTLLMETENAFSASCEGWQCRVLAEVPSTNSYAGRLPPWTAVRAVTQTAGRGRTPDRRWVSDEGGLWISAVVPCPGDRIRWALLPLAAGWAVLDALRRLGVSEIRLRWPNDIMVDSRKLAGVLVERFTDETAVIGVGVNVFNHPERADFGLAESATRLADVLPGVAFTLDDVGRRILRELWAAHAVLREGGPGPIADALNQHWKQPRRVQLTLKGRSDLLEGLFHGIDEHGRLCLQTKLGGPQLFDPIEVALLREVA